MDLLNYFMKILQQLQSEKIHGIFKIEFFKYHSDTMILNILLHLFICFRLLLTFKETNLHPKCCFNFLRLKKSLY